jgi:hypothetical protein
VPRPYARDMTSPDDPFAAPRPGEPGPAPGNGPPPGAGAPYAGWQPAPQTSGRSVAVLVLAVCSFVVFPVIPAVVALALAPGASRDIAAAGGRLTGDGLLKAGRIVAWVNLGLALGFVLLMILMLGVFGILATTATG